MHANCIFRPSRRNGQLTSVYWLTLNDTVAGFEIDSNRDLGASNGSHGEPDVSNATTLFPKKVAVQEDYSHHLTFLRM